MIHALKTNWKLYAMEALGLAIFMISACFFTALLESENSEVHRAITLSFTRSVIMGFAMGLTALFIFYSRFTSASGSQINPAVTITFLRLGKIQKWDAFYYIIFQFVGGTLAVYIMASLMDDMLTAPPVNYVVTVPGKYGIWGAACMEFFIAFTMMCIVLFTSDYEKSKKYTRIIASCFVCFNVIVAGPVSGFGMNPARTFSSALPANIWCAFWIYLLIPILAMLCAAEYYLFWKRYVLNDRSSCDLET